MGKTWHWNSLDHETKGVQVSIVKSLWCKENNLAKAVRHLAIDDVSAVLTFFASAYLRGRFLKAGFHMIATISTVAAIAG